MPPAGDEGIRQVVEPLVRARRCTLYDLEFQRRGSTQLLRVYVDRPGGVDTDTCAAVSQVLSRTLDDADLITGPYTLEVSSPGIERALRRPEHFAAVAGSDLTARVKVRGESAAGARVVEGPITHAGETTFRVGQEEVPYSAVISARTVFTWPAQPKTRTDPRSGRQRGQKRISSPKEAAS